VNIVRTFARMSSNRFKFCWLKVICCICQSNELEREIKHKTGGKAGRQPKIRGAMVRRFATPSLCPCTLVNNLPVSDKNAFSVLFFPVIDQIFFKWPKTVSQLFGHNVLKRRLVNTVTTSFNTVTGQMIEMS